MFRENYYETSPTTKGLVELNQKKIKNKLIGQISLKGMFCESDQENCCEFEF